MPQSISVSNFKPIWDTQLSNPKAIIIDVRTPAEYKEIHVEGAKNIPLDKLSKRIKEVETFDQVYVLCKAGGRSHKACTHLAELDKDLVVVEGGTDAWDKAGYPVIKISVKLPLMRQVMLAAGSLVLLGTVGSLLLNTSLIYLAIFVGAGLVFSGTTGWCGMALLLGKMPWNK